MKSQPMERKNEQEDSVKFVAKMLSEQCACHLRETDNEFTEAEIENMYYDHLLSEIAKMK